MSGEEVGEQTVFVQTDPDEGKEDGRNERQRERGVTLLWRNIESFPALALLCRRFKLSHSHTEAQTLLYKCSPDTFQMCVKKLATTQHSEHINEVYERAGLAQYSSCFGRRWEGTQGGVKVPLLRLDLIYLKR